jgi:ABC-2 type transport system permease protein
VNGVLAVFYRDCRQRITNIAFVFWDLFVPIAYLLLFGLGFELTLGSQFAVRGQSVDYLDFFLPNVLAMATFSIAMNTA